jgi:arsenate reductase
MAEGLLRSIAGDRLDVFSAGTKPVGLNPNAIAAMCEIGIDISSHRSKSVEEFAGRQFDYVITVCDHAREACPLFPGSGKQIHRSFSDPAAAARGHEAEAFRSVRNSLSAWLQTFVAAELSNPETTSRE